MNFTIVDIISSKKGSDMLSKLIINHTYTRPEPLLSNKIEGYRIITRTNIKKYESKILWIDQIKKGTQLLAFLLMLADRTGLEPDSAKPSP